jgi:phospholipid transport system substrate-binding protein
MPAIRLAYQSDVIDRRSMLRLALAAGVAGAAAISGVPAHAADAAAEPIGLLGSSLVRLMQNGGSPFAQRFAQFAPVVDRTFDLQAILRTSVGAHWDTMDVGEQADLMKVFRQYTVARFVASFNKYSGEQFRITGTRDVPAGDKVVETKIGDTQVSYVIRQSAAGWRVIDVLADGSISQVATQRSDFRATLSHGGGQALVASLQRKVSDLSGGSLA